MRADRAAAKRHCCNLAMVSHTITIHQKDLLMENVKDFTESWAPVVIMDSALGNPSSKPKLKKNNNIKIF